MAEAAQPDAANLSTGRLRTMRAVSPLHDSRSLVVLIALVIGSLLAAGRLLQSKLLTAVAAVLVSGAIIPFVKWLGGLLFSDVTELDFGKGPRRALLFGLSAILSYFVSYESMQVNEYAFGTDLSSSLGHASTVGSAFNSLLACNGRRFAFGYRTDKSEGRDYHDAIVWASDSQTFLGNWLEPMWDPPNRGGVERMTPPGAPAKRNFVGALCDGSKTIAFGWDNLAVPSVEPMIWVEDRKPTLTETQWVRKPNNLGSLGAVQIAGISQVGVGYDAPDRHVGKEPEQLSTPPLSVPSSAPVLQTASKEDKTFLAFLSLGSRRGVACAESSDLATWKNSGVKGLEGWTVSKVVGGDSYVAIASRVNDSGARENALFSSRGCSGWRKVALPKAFERNAQINTVSFANDRWFVTGWKTATVKYYPLLASGRSLGGLKYQELRRPDSKTFTRGIYAIAGDGENLVALCFDYRLVEKRSVEGYTDEDVVMSVTPRRARAVRVPLIGVVLRAHSTSSDAWSSLAS